MALPALSSIRLKLKILIFSNKKFKNGVLTLSLDFRNFFKKKKLSGELVYRIAKIFKYETSDDLDENDAP